MSARAVARRILARLDQKFAEELAKKPRVVFHRLRRRGFLEGLTGKRILEIGPSHGWDSALLAGLEPSDLVLIDLPEKRGLVESWLPRVQPLTNTRFIEGNLLYLDPALLDRLGTFDLIWCLGVLYHNAEQLRLIGRLRTLCSDGGKVVIETHNDRSRESIVRIHWPEPWGGVPTMTHVPSRTAVKAWMEMAGFSDVRTEPILSRLTSRKREPSSRAEPAESRTACMPRRGSTPTTGWVRRLSRPASASDVAGSSRSPALFQPRFPTGFALRRPALTMCRPVHCRREAFRLRALGGSLCRTKRGT